MATITSRSREVRSPWALLTRDFEQHPQPRASASSALLEMAKRAFQEISELRSQMLESPWEGSPRFEFMTPISSRSASVRIERGASGTFLPFPFEDD